MQARLDATEAKNEAARELLPGDSVEKRFAALEQEDQVEQRLAELKSRQTRLLAAG